MIILIIGTNTSFLADWYSSSSFVAFQKLDLVLAKMTILVVWQNDSEKQEAIFFSS